MLVLETIMNRAPLPPPPTAAFHFKPRHKNLLD